jgi:hypothetical protein
MFGFLKVVQLKRFFRDSPEMTDEEIARATGIPTDHVREAREVL